jgi:isopentenyl-diphosphate delta-isomerase type 1
MKQLDFMAKDECIVVDEADRITGHSSKHACHRFEGVTPKGLLHRAFSVFLFDDAGRLLLQQRASDKITFPSVWTNTCCSHPLMGQTPDEVDQEPVVLDGTCPGIRNAAVRKLYHELGIPAAQLPLSSFTFLTRLHYCAADTHTHGPDAEWGEHEVDYILFIKANVTLAPNAEEVDAAK